MARCCFPSSSKRVSANTSELYVEEDSQKPWESKEKNKRYLQAVLKTIPKRVVTQTDVALTYASTGFVSLIDLGFIYTLQGTYTPRIIRGLTLDLERRQIFTMEACPEGSFRRPGAIFDPAFRFADLLEICDQASLERFEAVVQAAEDRTKAATAGSKDPLVEGCRGTSIDEEQEFIVYLAVGGLAVHLRQFWIKNGTLWSELEYLVLYFEVERSKPAHRPLSRTGASHEAGTVARGIAEVEVSFRRRQREFV